MGFTHVNLGLRSQHGVYGRKPGFTTVNYGIKYDDLLLNTRDFYLIQGFKLIWVLNQLRNAAEI